MHKHTIPKITVSRTFDRTTAEWSIAYERSNVHHALKGPCDSLPSTPTPHPHCPCLSCSSAACKQTPTIRRRDVRHLHSHFKEQRGHCSPFQSQRKLGKALWLCVLRIIRYWHYENSNKYIPDSGMRRHTILRVTVHSDNLQ